MISSSPCLPHHQECWIAIATYQKHHSYLKCHCQHGMISLWNFFTFKEQICASCTIYNSIYVLQQFIIHLIYCSTATPLQEMRQSGGHSWAVRDVFTLRELLTCVLEQGPPGYLVTNLVTNLSPNLVTNWVITKFVTKFGDDFGDQFSDKFSDHQIWWKNRWNIWWQKWWSPNLVASLVTKLVPKFLTELVITKFRD